MFTTEALVQRRFFFHWNMSDEPSFAAPAGSQDSTCFLGVPGFPQGGPQWRKNDQEIETQQSLLLGISYTVIKHGLEIPPQVFKWENHWTDHIAYGFVGWIIVVVSFLEAGACYSFCVIWWPEHRASLTGRIIEFPLTNVSKVYRIVKNDDKWCPGMENPGLVQDVQGVSSFCFLWEAWVPEMAVTSWVSSRLIQPTRCLLWRFEELCHCYCETLGYTWNTWKHERDSTFYRLFS